MALWLTALKVLPWGDMIEYAPKVVSGAQKAWQRVKSGRDAALVEQTAPLPGDPQTELELLREEVRQLQAQQLDLSKLATQLADQNQRLVDAVAVLRMRTRLLLFGFGLSAAAFVVVAVR